jgi:hypothetical protein
VNSIRHDQTRIDRPVPRIGSALRTLTAAPDEVHRQQLKDQLHSAHREAGVDAHRIVRITPGVWGVGDIFVSNCEEDAGEGDRWRMSELLRWQTEDGPVVIEVDSDDPGLASIARCDSEIIDVKERFEEALDKVRGAAVSALKAFSDKSLAPDEVSLEFGVKFNVSAGAVIAKTSTEGNLTVRLTWAPGHGESSE